MSASEYHNSECEESMLGPEGREEWPQQGRGSAGSRPLWSSVNAGKGQTQVYGTIDGSWGDDQIPPGFLKLFSSHYFMKTGNPPLPFHALMSTFLVGEHIKQSHLSTCT